MPSFQEEAQSAAPSETCLAVSRSPGMPSCQVEELSTAPFETRLAASHSPVSPTTPTEASGDGLVTATAELPLSTASSPLEPDAHESAITEEGPAGGGVRDVPVGNLKAARRQLISPEKERIVNLIERYLLENAEEYRQLSGLREEGWNNPAGDTFFQKQRHAADNANEKLSQIFYNTMKEIGWEMHKTTGGALAISKQPSDSPQILDMCCAPGGFLATSMDVNPGVQVLGFSLPVSQGGYKIRVPEQLRLSIKFLDVTMLAADMGVTDIAEGHADAAKFLPRQFETGQLFDLVMCDGQVFRPNVHQRAAYREKREARRLTVTQLALGLEHLNPGGTFIILLHKVEAPDTMILLHTFSKFSSIQLFKPVKHHSKRSSFYMVATNVQSQHPDAIQAVKTWKEKWKTATFGTDEENEGDLRAGLVEAEKVLGEFGPELVAMSRKVWVTQADALRRASFTNHKASGKAGTWEQHLKNANKSWAKKQSQNDTSRPWMMKQNWRSAPGK